MSLDDALAVARAIVDQYGGRSTSPLDIGIALHLQPSTGQFSTLLSASVAYGLTDGYATAATVSVLPLAKRILRPTAEGDDEEARREAFLRPRVIKEFFTQYNGGKLPREDIGVNVLTGLGVPEEAGKRVWSLMIAGARKEGLVRDINGVPHVALTAAQVRTTATAGAPTEDEEEHEAPASENESVPASPAAAPTRQDSRRVFITHGSNKAFIDPLKELLGFGELEAVVAVEEQSVSQPVPDKVMHAMRSCSAAIIHVDAEQKLLDPDGEVVVVLNPNVLIEIGAAMALYGRRFILLVKEGVGLPSNVQGLYEVRYQGDKLDGDATIRLLKAIKDIRNHPLP